MNRRNLILFALLGIAVLVIIIYGFNTAQDPVAYAESIMEERKETERFFLYNDESPFGEEEKQSFSGLKYYEPDLAFKVRAKVAQIEDDQQITLPTSDGRETTYRKYGYAQFEINGIAQRLLLLELRDEPDELFIAFTDQTSARETYGGGRYLDVAKPSSSNIVLDFNLAYNPFCAYVKDYSCPFPPVENSLSVPIRAGEKNY